MRAAPRCALLAALIIVAAASHSGDAVGSGWAQPLPRMGSAAGSGWNARAKCCRPTWGSPEMSMCSLDDSWEILVAKVQAGKVHLKTGGLGTSSVRKQDGSGLRFGVWLCVRSSEDYHVPCDTDGGAFCFVYDEVDAKFVPWGLNSELRLFDSMSPAPFEDSKALFAELDQNGDGCFDEKEFVQNPPPVAASFNEISKGDGCITYEEDFLPFVGRQDYEYALAWTSMDADEDGCLTKIEFDDVAAKNPLREKGYSYAYIFDSAYDLGFWSDPQATWPDGPCVTYDLYMAFGAEYDFYSAPSKGAAQYISGEVACEGHSFTEIECLEVGCCQWDSTTGGGGACWSKVGDGMCPGLKLKPEQVASMFFDHFDEDGSKCLSHGEFERFADYLGAPRHGEAGSGSGHGRQVEHLKKDMSVE